MFPRFFGVGWVVSSVRGCFLFLRGHPCWALFQPRFSIFLAPSPTEQIAKTNMVRDGQSRIVIDLGEGWWLG